MKGLIFTEFLDLVEEKFGAEVSDNIIENSNLPHGGAYTSVGTYPHEEIVALVVNLSKETKIDVPTLLDVFGEHIFGRFATGYSYMFEGIDDAFTFLEKIQNQIHVEVLKLYPEAQLPFIEVASKSDTEMVLIYSSERSMADLALGLIKGCLKHFDEEASVTSENIHEDKSKVKFIVTK